jgi:hypothetical protein
MAPRVITNFQQATSPSTWHRTMHCPGWVSLYERTGFSRSVENDIAARGTRIHKYSELMHHGKPLPPDADKEEVAHAEQYVTFCKNAKKQFLQNRELLLEMIEQDLDIGLGYKGQTDWGLIAKDRRGIHVLLTDLKTGYTDVEAEGNEQIVGYLRGIQNFVNDMFNELPTYYYAFIFQQGVWVKVEYDGNAFFNVTAEILRKLDIARQMYDKEMSIELEIGKGCMYCPVLGQCPKFGEEVMAIEKQLKNVELLSDQQLVHINRLSKPIEKFLAAVEGKLLTKLVEGQKIEGAILSQGKGKRVWANPAEAEMAFREKGVDPFVEPKLQGVTFGDSVLGKELMDGLTIYTAGNYKVGIPGKDKEVEVEKVEFESVEPIKALPSDVGSDGLF